MNGPIETNGEGITNDPPVLVRPSRDGDVEAMLAIYRHHIRSGIDEGVDDGGTPEPDDLRDRRKNLRSHRLPHLVATCGGDVVGYAYVVLFRKRPAYRYAVKHSIYVHHARVGRGVGGRMGDPSMNNEVLVRCEARKDREPHRSSAPDDLREPCRQDETRRTVDLGHSSDGPS